MIFEDDDDDDDSGRYMYSDVHLHVTIEAGVVPAVLRTVLYLLCSLQADTGCSNTQSDTSTWQGCGGRGI